MISAMADLREALTASVMYEDAKAALEAAKNPQQLVAAWWSDCDCTEGEVHSLLFEIYREKLRKFGAGAS